MLVLLIKDQPDCSLNQVSTKPGQIQPRACRGNAADDDRHADSRVGDECPDPLSQCGGAGGRAGHPDGRAPGRFLAQVWATHPPKADNERDQGLRTPAH